MIETPEARAKRIKAEKADRAARAASYAKKMGATPSLPPAAKNDGQMGKLEAQLITRKIKESHERTLEMLVEAHDRGAWKAMGYDSWGKYTEAEFDFKQARGYQLLTHAKTVQAIENSTNVEIIPKSEAQTRPMKNLPAKTQGRAWKAALKSTGGEQPTGKQVATIVAAIKPAKAHVVATEPNLPILPEPRCCPTCKRPLP
jgi:hypothetical protein